MNEYNEKRAELLAKDPAMEQSEIIQAFVEEPHYDCRNRGPRKSTEDAMAEIEKCLKLNEEKRARCPVIARNDNALPVFELD